MCEGENVWKDESIALLQIISEIVSSTVSRKKVEDELQLLSSVVQQTREGIATSDMNGNLLFVNKALADMFGYSPEELIG